MVEEVLLGCSPQLAHCSLIQVDLLQALANQLGHFCRRFAIESDGRRPVESKTVGAFLIDPVNRNVDFIVASWKLNLHVQMSVSLGES